MLLHRCVCRFLRGIYTSYRPSVKEYITKWVRDGYRIFNAHPFGFYFICHSVISLAGSKYIAPDDYERANSRYYELSNERVSDFESNTDMCGALCASSQIPFLNCPNFFYTYRNNRCLDGGLTWNWVKLNENTIVISPYT